MFREAMKHQGKRNDFDDNVTEVDHRERGNSRAYSIDRVKRGCDEATVAAVMSGTMSPNAALVSAGLRENRQVYKTWWAMNDRCHSKDNIGYQYYGGRGIQVCERWRNSFEAFVSDVGCKPEGRTLDRIDNDGNYEPGNVRWSTHAEQARNCRGCRLNVRKVGRIKRRLRQGLPCADVARNEGVSYSAIYAIQTGVRWSDVPAD